jgi:transcriptional regulator with XRE-family HTH domain
MTKTQLINLTRRTIKKQKFTQAAFAREIDIGCDELSNFLNGHRNPPARLLAYLGYKPITLYERI